jgi:hypothetical protein
MESREVQTAIQGARLRATTVVILTAVLATAGCRATPSEAVPAADISSSAAPAALRLTARSVGSVPVGGPAATMEKELRRRLGPPTHIVDTEPCELAGPTDEKIRILSWKHLEVSVTSKGGAAKTVAGWTIRAGDLPSGLKVPYGVTTKTDVHRAMSLIPRAKGKYDKVFGLFQITTDQAPEMFWSGDEPDGSGPITFISNHVEFCE